MRPAHLAFLAILAACLPAAAQQAARDKDASDPQGSNDDQDLKQVGNNLTNPQNTVDLRFRYRESLRETTHTARDYWIARVTSRIPLDPDWKLSLLAQSALIDQSRSTEDAPAEEKFGLGNSLFQADLIRKLSENTSFGFGARLVAPTAKDDLGNGKWQIMPGIGGRYVFKELSKDTYFAPSIRYAVSFAGDPTKRNISEPQIAPTFNLDLPGPWFFTFYPSYDIRINYGDPVSGQTGRLFLPADVALGYSLTDKVTLSLEGGVPIIKDYPVYVFKTEFRIVIKY